MFLHNDLNCITTVLSHFYFHGEFLTSLQASSLIGDSGLSICCQGDKPGGTPPTHPMCPNEEQCLGYRTKKMYGFQNKFNLLFYFNFLFHLISMHVFLRAQQPKILIIQSNVTL